MAFDIKTAKPINQSIIKSTRPVFDIKSAKPTTQSKLSDLGKGALQTIKNIPTDIARTGAAVGRLATETVPQTIANIAVNPKYGLKTAARDIGAVGSGLADVVAQGIANVAIQPMSKTISDIGKYVQNNPASTIFDLATVSPKGSIFKGLATKVSEAASKVTRRGMGFSPKMVEGRGALEFANDTAKELLKKDLIPLGGSTEKTYQNILKLNDESGEALGSIRSVFQESGKKALNPVELDD